MVFHNVARALTSSLDLDSVLRVLMQQMEQFFQPETWSLLILDGKKEELYYAVAMGHAEAELRNLRVQVSEASAAGWVVLRGETLIVPDATLDPRFRSLPERRSVAQVSSAICIPLRSRLRTLGVLQLFNCRVEMLTDYTISFLHVLCDFAAIAIENAQSVERIQELTITDDCTGLYNVRHLYTMLATELERSSRTQAPFSLVFIDLDHFKGVNDRHGHLVGSTLLAELGRALRALVRRVDSCFRYGGDEFTILLPETCKDEAEQAAMHLRAELREMSFQVGDGLRLSVQASFGVATWPEDGETAQEVIRAADQMMYLVKATTRDGVAVAGRGLRTPVAGPEPVQSRRLTARRRPAG